MHSPLSIRRVAARAGIAVGRVSDVPSHPQFVAEATPARANHPATEVTASARTGSRRHPRRACPEPCPTLVGA
jgi:hypothetical protein